VTEVRVFKGRDSTGVRGISLGKEDEVISMAILRHVDASADERAGYLRMRRAVEGEPAATDAAAPAEGEEELAANAAALSPERYTEMSAQEQFVLTISERGFGKRTSSYEYRITGRGGKGIVAMVTAGRNGPLRASFPVEDADQLMLVTNGGQLIRVPVDGIRVAGRATQGVTIFNTGPSEKVVSVEHLEGEEAEQNGELSEDAGENGDAGDTGEET
jgi:DNA gyrase subunit A